MLHDEVRMGGDEGMSCERSLVSSAVREASDQSIDLINVDIALLCGTIETDSRANIKNCI